MLIKRQKLQPVPCLGQATIDKLRQRKGYISLSDFRQLALLGSGDMGSVYLVEAIETGVRFAMKVMEMDALMARARERRADLERDILAELHHPFLPTLYATIQTREHRCLITDYCPKGDMWDLLKAQPHKRFSERTTRFYASEILCALEYLHLKGVVYRDLKPENILLQDDGHVMLTDFDLAVRLKSSAKVVPHKSVATEKQQAKSKKRDGSGKSRSRWQFAAAIVSAFRRPSPVQEEAMMMPDMITSVTGTSNSLVGTVEYTAPEVILGRGHDSCVDWWTFGILLFEMLYGYPPFSGNSRQETYMAILEQPLQLPPVPRISGTAKNLLGLLLRKDPKRRLGSVLGAAEIKQHPFFRGVNWALLRTQAPPTFHKKRRSSLSGKSNSGSSWSTIGSPMSQGGQQQRQQEVWGDGDKNMFNSF